MYDDRNKMGPAHAKHVFLSIELASQPLREIIDPKTNLLIYSYPKSKSFPRALLWAMVWGLKGAEGFLAVIKKTNVI